MAIAQVGGANNNNAVGVTTLSVTYSPTNNNIIIVALNTSAGTGYSVKDNNNVALTAGPAQNNLQIFYYKVTGSPTSFTASWTGSSQAGMAVEEYSGASDVNADNAANHNNANSGTATISVRINQANNWIVAALASANTITTTVGNQRQQVAASTARVTLQDNTSGTINTSIANTDTLTTANWAAVALELGQAGAARVQQDLTIAVNQPTTAHARIEQDITLAINRPSIQHARIEQDVLIAVVSNNKLLQIHVKHWINQWRKKKKKHAVQIPIGFQLHGGGKKKRPYTSVIT